MRSVLLLAIAFVRHNVWLLIMLMLWPWLFSGVLSFESENQISEAIVNSCSTAIGSTPAAESARSTTAATAMRIRTGRRNRVEAISRAAPPIRSRHAVSFIASSACGLAGY